MYGYESWTIKKAEWQKINAFELWCWRRLMRVPWTAKRSNLSILKEINPEYSLKGRILKLKLQYFGHMMWRADSFEKTLMLGKIEGGRRRGWQRWDGWRASSIQWMWVCANSGSWWWTGRLGVQQFTGSQRVGHDWAIQLNWTYQVVFATVFLPVGDLSFHFLKKVFHRVEIFNFIMKSTVSLVFLCGVPFLHCVLNIKVHDLYDQAIAHVDLLLCFLL